MSKKEMEYLVKFIAILILILFSGTGVVLLELLKDNKENKKVIEIIITDLRENDNDISTLYLKQNDNDYKIYKKGE